jgi:hypothetical protein
VVTADDDLVPVLEAAFAAGGVQLVAVPIDYSENIRGARRAQRPPPQLRACRRS